MLDNLVATSPRVRNILTQALLRKVLMRNTARVCLVGCSHGRCREHPFPCRLKKARGDADAKGEHDTGHHQMARPGAASAAKKSAKKCENLPHHRQKTDQVPAIWMIRARRIQTRQISSTKMSLTSLLMKAMMAIQAQKTTMTYFLRKTMTLYFLNKLLRNKKYFQTRLILTFGSWEYFKMLVYVFEFRPN